MIKKERGITLISLSIAVIIILTITGMIIYSAKDSIYIKNLTNMQNDIANLRDKVSLYYSEYGDIPAKTEYPDVSNLQSAGVLGVNDTGKFLILELENLEGLTLNYGEDYEKYKVNDYTNLTDLTDIYIINENSHNIFYVEGIRVKENDETKMYYTDYTEGDTEKVDVKTLGNWHEETNEAGETIITNGVAQLKIGDYVNYNPQDGATETSYTSKKENSGYTEDQVFNLASYQYGWRVLGVDERTNEILLVSEDFIGPDSGGYAENERTYYCLRGQTGYVNGQSELSNISQLYGQGKGASGARSITVEDINKITGYDPTSTGNGNAYAAGEIKEYGNTVTYTKNAQTGYIECSGSNGVSETSTYTSFIYYDEGTQNWKTLEKGQSVTIDSSIYYYYPNTLTISANGTTVGIETNTTAYEMLFKNSVNSAISNSCRGNITGCWYWLASSSVTAGSAAANYSLRFVNNGYVGGGKVFKDHLFYTYNATNSIYRGVRVVVSLESNISILGGEGTAENSYELIKN